MEWRRFVTYLSNDPHMNTFFNIQYETRISISPGRVWEGSESGNTISNATFLIVLHSNYETILLCFRDITTGWTTD